MPYFAPVGWASLLHSFFEVCLFRQQHFLLQSIFVLATKQRVNWHKPEQAPHRRVECDPCLFVCMRMSYRKYTLLQITDPEFTKDCMCHVNHILVQWPWRDLCSQSTSQATPQTREEKLRCRRECETEQEQRLSKCRTWDWARWTQYKTSHLNEYHGMCPHGHVHRTPSMTVHGMSE